MISRASRTPPNIASDRSAFKRELEGAMQAPAMDTPDLDSRFVGVLKIMDRGVLQMLGGGSISLTDINRELKTWAGAVPNSDESHVLEELKKSIPSYVLIAQYMSSRIYSKDQSGKYHLSAQLDSQSVENYQGAPVKFIPLDEKDGLFLLAHGRVGQTAIFYKLWRFDGISIHGVWDSGHDFMALERLVPEGVVMTRCGKGPMRTKFVETPQSRVKTAAAMSGSSDSRSIRKSQPGFKPATGRSERLQAQPD